METLITIRKVLCTVAIFQIILVLYYLSFLIIKKSDLWQDSEAVAEAEQNQKERTTLVEAESDFKNKKATVNT